ncbi:hypothetical protein ACFOOL_04580 [Devosia honganensis]|uniref:Uncharacterized protein n=1 Tax=Devosia honganensis TaxID=1610527 RepID=A0ABV7WZR0_9HYPH
MASVGDMQRESGLQGRMAHWHGRSGRSYGLAWESLESFSMHEADLYLIAKGGHVLWVGSTQELVGDPLSRARFRLALDCATHVFRLPAPDNRPSAIWDLEGASPEAAVQAA